MFDLWYNIKSHIPLLWKNPSIVYLDNASTTQKPQQIINAMNNYQTSSYANIHRGVYTLAEQSEQWYLSSKKKIAQFIGALHQEIIYTYNATYASNIFAQSLIATYNLWEWDIIFLWIWDHHATIVPWQLLSKQYGFTLQYIPIDMITLDIERSQYIQMLEQYHPKVVICSHVSNVTGAIYDVTRLTQQAKQHSHDTLVVLDGSQAVPHIKVDVHAIGCDAYFFTGHKVMGPTGIGVLWVKKDVVRSLQSLLGWWGIIESVTIEWCSLIRTADKFEPWTPNLIGAVGLGAAVDFYTEYIDFDLLHQHELIISDRLRAWIRHISDIRLIELGLHMSHCGIVSFALQSENLMDFSEYLADHGVCVRAGGHCAHPLLHTLWYDNGVVRISPFAYTTIDDIDYTIQVIQQYFSEKWVA